MLKLLCLLYCFVCWEVGFLYKYIYRILVICYFVLYLLSLSVFDFKLNMNFKLSNKFIDLYFIISVFVVWDVS